MAKIRNCRIVTFIKVLTVSIIVAAMVISYYAYKKHREYWRKEEEWVDFLSEQGRQSRLTLRPKKKQPDIYNLNKPLIIINSSMSDREVEERFFRYIETKDVKCMDSLRLGSQHDGGYNVCMSPPFGLTAPCYVFSFGIYGDWNFDDAVSQIYKCNVYAYDHTEQNVQQDRSKLIHFEKVGLDDKDGRTSRGDKMKTFGTFLHELRLANTPISYLKIDIEYREWAVLAEMIQDGSLANVKQIGFEIHTKELHKKVSTKRDYLSMYNRLRSLESRGFRRYDHRNNPFGAFTSNVTKKARSCCYELYYINTGFMSSLPSIKNLT